MYITISDDFAFAVCLFWLIGFVFVGMRDFARMIAEIPSGKDGLKDPSWKKFFFYFILYLIMLWILGSFIYALPGSYQ